MASKFIILALTYLAYVNAGYIAQPEPVHYSSAPAVSSSYFQQASSPSVAATYGAPAAQYVTKSYAAPAQYVAKSYAVPSTVATYSAPSITTTYGAPSAQYVTKSYATPVATYGAPAALAQPVTYHAVHAPSSVGVSQQSVARSLGGAQSVSSYSKAVDSAFSSVRKYDTRITNDALSYAPAQVSYSAPALVTKSLAYAAPANLVTKTYSAQVPSGYSYAAPAQVYAHHAAPSVYSYSAPASSPSYTTYSSAPAPILSYSAHQQVPASSAVLTKTAYASAPILTKSYAPAAPLTVAKTAISYSPSDVVAHTTFQGYGVEYHY